MLDFCGLVCLMVFAEDKLKKQETNENINRTLYGFKSLIVRHEENTMKYNKIQKESGGRRSPLRPPVFSLCVLIMSNSTSIAFIALFVLKSIL